MISLARGGERFLPKVIALTLWIGVFSGVASAVSYGSELDDSDQNGDCGLGRSTLGSAPFGFYPGFFGFGLSYHLGYGYGGDALGVGGDGGYPFYGGPGYFHDAPALARFGHIVPFAYYGGPGYPFSFTEPGQLAVDRPLVISGDAMGQGYAYDVGFGPFTGAIPYPDSVFAPYAAQATTTGTFGGASSPSPAAIARADRVVDLGIDEEPVVDGDGARGMKVSKVYPGTPAEKAGLKPGDVIRSINGYLTEKPGNLTWIIANKAPGKVLKITVHAAPDGNERTVTVQLP
jgi:hypothetical protein